MPGIDFNRLRAEITMEQVLKHLGFEPSSRSGRPMARALSRARIHVWPRSRTFSVNLAHRRYYCHKCHSQGNQLELWAAVTQLPIYEAAIDLCRTSDATSLGSARW